MGVGDVVTTLVGALMVVKPATFVEAGAEDEAGTELEGEVTLADTDALGVRPPDALGRPVRVTEPALIVP